MFQDNISWVAPLMIAFAAIVSFGEKDVYGILYLLNESGEIIDKNDKKVFNRILGFTDANRDGIHELMIFKGSGYGGGDMYIYYLSVLSYKKSLILSTRVNSNSRRLKRKVIVIGV